MIPFFCHFVKSFAILFSNFFAFCRIKSLPCWLSFSILPFFVFFCCHILEQFLFLFYFRCFFKKEVTGVEFMGNGIPLVMIRAPLGFGYFSWRTKNDFSRNCVSKINDFKQNNQKSKFLGLFFY